MDKRNHEKTDDLSEFSNLKIFVTTTPISDEMDISKIDISKLKMVEIYPFKKSEGDGLYTHTLGFPQVKIE